jgi:hypothetical protein
MIQAIHKQIIADKNEIINLISEISSISVISDKKRLFRKAPIFSTSPENLRYCSKRILSPQGKIPFTVIISVSL